MIFFFILHKFTMINFCLSSKDEVLKIMNRYGLLIIYLYFRDSKMEITLAIPV